MKKFQDTLKDFLKKIVGKRVSLSGPSNCIRITLSSGKEYWGTIEELESDFFTISVSYTGGGEESIAVKFKEVAAFSME